MVSFRKILAHKKIIAIPEFIMFLLDSTIGENYTFFILEKSL